MLFFNGPSFDRPVPFIDGQFGIYLWSKPDRKRGAVISFVVPDEKKDFCRFSEMSLPSDNNFLFNCPWIVQVQGARINEPVLPEISWPKVLFELIILWSKLNGFPRLFSVSARQQKYYELVSPKIKERMRRIYDSTPEKLGFTLNKFNPRHFFWLLDLTMI